MVSAGRRGASNLHGARLDANRQRVQSGDFSDRFHLRPEQGEIETITIGGGLVLVTLNGVEDAKSGASGE